MSKTDLPLRAEIFVSMIIATLQAIRCRHVRQENGANRMNERPVLNNKNFA
jgi:hypothetical protein